MKRFVVGLFFGLSIIAHAAPSSTQVYKGTTNGWSRGEPCTVTITKDESITRVMGEAEGTTIQISGDSSALQAGWSGHASSGSMVEGSILNEGIGKQSVTFRFSDGKPSSAKFSSCYLFLTGYKSFNCYNLVEESK